MKLVVCLYLVLGATFVRGQDEPATFNETSTSQNLALNETNAQTMEMEANASETNSTTSKNETISPSSNPETSSESLLTTSTALQDNVTTFSPTEFFDATSQQNLSVANFTELGENVTEDQLTTPEPVSRETMVFTATDSTIPEITNATEESTGADTQNSTETTAQETTLEVISESVTVPEWLITSLGTTTNVTSVATKIPSQQSVVQVETTHDEASATTMQSVTDSTESSVLAQPNRSCSGFFECFDIYTISLILLFAAGAVFVIIISFVICRKCVKSSPDGKYTLMSSSESQ